MILELEKRFNSFEELRVETLNAYNNFTKEQLHFKPNADSWSITETFHHLYLSETGTYLYISKKMQSIDELPKSGFKNAWRTFLLKIYLRSNKKFKVPKKAPVNPSGNMAFGDLVEQWNQLRKDFAQQLNQFDVESAKKLTFKHPRIGYINVHQVLTFLEEHFKHHFMQLDAIKKDANFPK